MKQKGKTQMQTKAYGAKSMNAKSEKPLLEPRKDMEGKARPITITIYAVLLLLSVLSALISLTSSQIQAVLMLGAILNGPIYTFYILFWLALDLALLFGIYKRKEWTPNIAIAVIATQTLISLGQIFFIEQSIELALSQAGTQLTASQAASAMGFAKTLGYIMTGVGIVINVIFMRSFHMNRDFFSEKGYM